MCKDTLKLEPRSVVCSTPYGGSDLKINRCPRAPWCITCALRQLENLSFFFKEIVCWAPLISQVQSVLEFLLHIFLKHSLVIIVYNIKEWSVLSLLFFSFYVEINISLSRVFHFEYLYYFNG